MKAHFIMTMFFSIAIEFGLARNDYMASHSSIYKIKDCKVEHKSAKDHQDDPFLI